MTETTVVIANWAWASEGWRKDTDIAVGNEVMKRRDNKYKENRRNGGTVEKQKEWEQRLHGTNLLQEMVKEGDEKDMENQTNAINNHVLHSY